MTGQDPLVLIEDQERPLIWLDPDPRAPDDLWDPRPPRRDRLGLVAVVAAGLAILLAGIVIGHAIAAPRSSVQPAIPAGASSMESEAVPWAPASSGNLAVRSSGAPPWQQGDAEPFPGVSDSSAIGVPLPPPAAAPDQSPAVVTEPPAIAGGLASWCAPTPTHCQGWGGNAHLGAVPSFRYGDRPYRVRVCRADDGSRCTVVRVVSFCGCGDKLIDLSPAAFAELAPLSRGVVAVTVEDLAAPGLTPPPTDVGP